MLAYWRGFSSVHERVHSKESNDISLITGSIPFSEDYAGKRINVTVGAACVSISDVTFVERLAASSANIWTLEISFSFRQKRIRNLIGIDIALLSF